eukprot:3926317-Amphidinium_carterae.1
MQEDNSLEKSDPSAALHSKWKVRARNSDSSGKLFSKKSCIPDLKQLMSSERTRGATTLAVVFFVYADGWDIPFVPLL